MMKKICIYILFFIIFIGFNINLSASEKGNIEENEELLKNTNITTPENNSEVYDDILIQIKIESCNCSSKPSLFIDGEFVYEINLFNMENQNGKWYETYYFSMDTRNIPNGRHSIKVIGKHKEYSDEIEIIINNLEPIEEEEPGFIPSYSGITLIGAILILLITVKRDKR